MFSENLFSGKEGDKQTRLILFIFICTVLMLLLTIGTAGARGANVSRHSMSEPDLNFNILMGSRDLSDSSWKENTEFVAGFEVDLKSNTLPLNWSLGLHSSRATKIVSNGVYTERAFRINEFTLGVRKYIKTTYRTRLYGGGGLAMVNSDGSYKNSEPPYDMVSEREFGFGYYVNAGGDLRLGGAFHIGADVKVSGGTEMSSGTDVDDTDTAIFVGWGF